MQAVSDQRTIYNITTAMRTIVRGMTYLGTFICGANAVGLAGALNFCAAIPACISVLPCSCDDDLSRSAFVGY